VVGAAFCRHSVPHLPKSDYVWVSRHQCCGQRQTEQETEDVRRLPQTKGCHSATWTEAPLLVPAGPEDSADPVSVHRAAFHDRKQTTPDPIFACIFVTNIVPPARHTTLNASLITFVPFRSEFSVQSALPDVFLSWHHHRQQQKQPRVLVEAL
jgi:hypothetical protein